MLTKLVTVGRVAERAARYQFKNSIRCMGGYGGGKLEPLSDLAVGMKATYNDMAVEPVSYETYMKKRNAAYNMHLAGNVIVLIGTSILSGPKNGRLYWTDTFPNTNILYVYGVKLFYFAPDYTKLEIDAYKPLEEQE